MSETSTQVRAASPDGMPLYYKIYMVLEREILNHRYPPEIPLPSELELAQRFDVSRVTIRHTMSILERKNLIARQRGKGTFARPPETARPAVSSFDGLNQNIAEFETGTSVSILETGRDTAPGWVQAELAAGETEAQRIIRIRRDATGPFSYSACYLSSRAAEVLDLRELGNRTVIAALQDAGLPAARVEQRLTAVAAAPEIAKHLEIGVGAPLTLMRRTMYDADGAGFEFLETYYRADRFEYSVTLTRENVQSGPPRWVSKGD